MVLGASGKRWVLKDICMMKARHQEPQDQPACLVLRFEYEIEA